MLLDVLTAQIYGSEVRLAKSAAETTEVRLLLSLPGFQMSCAVGLLAAIGDVTRFAQPRKLVSYLGLDPLARSSADHAFGPNRISKRRRSHARWLLIEAATAAVRVPGPLKAFYLRLKVQKGHNKAIVATARKPAVISWHILTDGEPYHWAPPVQTREKIRKLEILAGAPKQRSGKKKGVASKGGRPRTGNSDARAMTWPSSPRRSMRNWSCNDAERSLIRRRAGAGCAHLRGLPAPRSTAWIPGRK